MGYVTVVETVSRDIDVSLPGNAVFEAVAGYSRYYTNLHSWNDDIYRYDNDTLRLWLGEGADGADGGNPGGGTARDSVGKERLRACRGCRSDRGQVLQLLITAALPDRFRTAGHRTRRFGAPAFLHDDSFRLDAMTSVWVHPRLGEVTLSQTRCQARRISISVRATGAVRLSFPHECRKTRLGISRPESRVDRAARERLARKQAPCLRSCRPPSRKPMSRSCVGPPGRPAGPHRAAVGGDGSEIRETYDSRLAHEVGELFGAQPHLAEPLSDGPAGAFARLCNHSRTLPYRPTIHSPRFHALVDRLVGEREKALNRELRAFTIR